MSPQQAGYTVKFDVPEPLNPVPLSALRNKTVEILIFPYENVNMEKHITRKTKRVRGLLKKYHNKDLQKLENEAWAQAVADNHEIVDAIGDSPRRRFVPIPFTSNKNSQKKCRRIGKSVE